MTHWVFDVDGTLTPSRQVITEEFYNYFLPFCKNNTVSVVTGSNPEKTQEQLADIVNYLKYVFACSGNLVFLKKRLIAYNACEPTDTMISWFNAKLEGSAFKVRTGNHIELRKGSINFSIVGRNADIRERLLYVNWDIMTSERDSLVKDFNSIFIDYEATKGGETGIDICRRGYNKAQVLKYITPIIFVGDACFAGGNDQPLYQTIKDNSSYGQAFWVTDWVDTLKLLKSWQD